MAIARVPSFARALIACALAACLPGCAMLGSCMFNCDSERSGTTSLVEFLYPDGGLPPQDSVAVLPVPMTVGLAFLPSASGSVADAALRESILTKVRDRFRKLPYVRDIVIVPDHYLTSSAGYESLQQISRLQGIDVFALVSSDQVSHRGENDRAVAYLTIVGSYFIRGSTNDTHTLLDLAVIEPKARTLLLRAAGTSALHDTSTAVEQGAKLRDQQSFGFDAAAEQLIVNLEKELVTFEERVRTGTAPVKVVKRQHAAGTAGAGSFDALALAVVAGFALTIALRSGCAVTRASARASRER
ncbi:MAG: rhombotarget lipoprotein [Gammaproteobacteria bacterium]